MNKEAIEKITTLLRSEIQLGKHQMTAADVIAKKIDAIYKSLGYVQLDPDQSLPTQAQFLSEIGKFSDVERKTYKQGQQDMLNNRFRKIK